MAPFPTPAGNEESVEPAGVEITVKLFTFAGISSVICAVYSVPGSFFIRTVYSIISPASTSAPLISVALLDGTGHRYAEAPSTKATTELSLESNT